MLDRSEGNQFHYYQPGIGTYITSNNLSHTSLLSRIRSSYLKAKDSAVGWSFDHHVMAGYQFLMQYYSPGDHIYFFGFSRGAYIARFLAEMLDYIGLLMTGNEELVRFAWKTFAKWQQRTGDEEKYKQKRRELFQFMKAFRETFSRPVERIRFLGLFDTVNSVPKFESAWMQRSKFPYTARSSARVIRHAVGIDERRAKFRQDLISGSTPIQRNKHRSLASKYRQLHHRHDTQNNVPAIVVDESKTQEYSDGTEKSSVPNSPESPSSQHYPPDSDEGNRYRAPARRPRGLNLSVPTPHENISTDDVASVASCGSHPSFHVPERVANVYEDDSAQDIQEVWFPGGHADIGGGWGLMPGEKWTLSHAPLVWMVHEAQRAGLQFDERKLKQFECAEEFGEATSPIQQGIGSRSVAVEEFNEKAAESGQQMSTSSQSFHAALHLSSAEGCLHDCLEFKTGLPSLSVLVWRFMEYLPFRRMDLQPDGSWKPIRWPLPCGEVRDIPADAQIHKSAIRRMQADKNYRPGNLIVGGGGRGVRKAPDHLGIGEWVVVGHEGDPVRETYVRKSESKKSEKSNGTNGVKNGEHAIPTNNGLQNGGKNGIHVDVTNGVENNAHNEIKEGKGNNQIEDTNKGIQNGTKDGLLSVKNDVQIGVNGDSLHF